MEVLRPVLVCAFLFVRNAIRGVRFPFGPRAPEGVPQAWLARIDDLGRQVLALGERLGGGLG